MPPPLHVVIPARYASSRLPGKPLADIGGKPMVVRVVEAVLSGGSVDICVATDDQRIRHAVEAHGYRVALTRNDHPSGTDRLAEVADQYRWHDNEIVINVQGDEPLIDPRLVYRVADALAEDNDAAVATAAHPIRDAEDFFNPAVVKVVTDARGRALYFSRAPIPWARDAFTADRQRLPPTLHALRHIGLYAYRAGFLRRYGSLAPSPLEGIEALEQLRAIWHGYPICVTVTEHAPATGVDTPEDLARVRQIFGHAER